MFILILRRLLPRFISIVTVLAVAALMWSRFSQICLTQWFDARSLDLLAPHIPTQVGLSPNKVLMSVGTIPTFKAINVELAQETLVFERSKVLGQDLSSKDLNVGDLEAIAIRYPLNG